MVWMIPAFAFAVFLFIFWWCSNKNPSPVSVSDSKQEAAKQMIADLIDPETAGKPSESQDDNTSASGSPACEQKACAETVSSSSSEIKQVGEKEKDQLEKPPKMKQ